MTSESGSGARGSRSPRKAPLLSLPARFMTLGVDLSLTATGIVVWDGDQVRHHKLVGTKTKDGQDELRIALIAKEVRKTVRLYVPALTLLENYAFGFNNNSASKLMELGGVVKNQLWRLTIPFHQIAPATVKKHATGNGRASKEEVIAAAQEVWPECPNNDNLADAFWLANYAFAKYDDLVTPS